MSAKKKLQELIKDKLGWEQEVVSALSPFEIVLILKMINKYDEAEKRLEHQNDRLTTVG